MQSLYVHIPFCASVCRYCDFAVLSAPEHVQKTYVQNLIREAEIRGPLIKPSCVVDQENPPYTIYLGGGTPSVLLPDLMDQLLHALSDLSLIHEKVKEFSVECNPESTTPQWISQMLNWGVSRFSLGIQSLNADLLNSIGRRHSPEQALQALNALLATKKRVSADLMFDLPGQRPWMFHQDLKRILQCGVTHISFYGLTIEPLTRLGQDSQRGRVKSNTEGYGEFYHPAVEILQQYGLNRYEISNFSCNGQESLHNQHYWDRGEYLGLGPGAHSFLQNMRSAAPKSFPRWVDWVRAGCPQSGMELDPIDRDAEKLERLWLGLRQNKGISLAEWDQLGIQWEHPIVQQNYGRGWLIKDNSAIKIHGEGWVHLDTLVANLASVME